MPYHTQQVMPEPGTTQDPNTLLSEKTSWLSSMGFVPLLVCGVFWCFFFLSMCVSMYIPSAYSMKKSLGKLSKTTRSVLLLSSSCCASFLQFDSHLPPPLL